MTLIYSESVMIFICASTHMCMSYSNAIHKLTGVLVRGQHEGKGSVLPDTTFVVSRLTVCF